MKFVMFFVVLLAVWFGFAYFLITPELSKTAPIATELTLPKSWNELGDALGVLNGLFNSVAILLGLIALYVQGRQINESITQQKLANQLAAKIAKQEFLLRESERLEASIQNLKSSNDYDKTLFTNMVNKKKRYLDEAKKLADEIAFSL